MTAPLVTIGIPVRNGAATLDLAIDSARRQTHPNIEIVVSDNASTDGTDAVIARHAALDDRIRVLRQSRSLTMFGNHAATHEAARGDFLIWLAHDDVLTETLVERLLAALEARPDAVLAFGQVRLFTDYEHFSDLRLLPHRFATDGMPVWRRLVRDRNSGWELKGLMRRRALDGYRWWEHTVSPDWPLLTHLLVVGEVIEVPDAELWVGYRADLKTTDERAALQSYRQVERFATITLCWRSALAARDAAAQVGRVRRPVVDFALLLAGLTWVRRGTLLSREAWRSRLARLRPAATSR